MDRDNIFDAWDYDGLTIGEVLEDLAVDMQDAAEDTAVYPGSGTLSQEEFMYLALGLGGEAGEVLNNVKKIYRDGLDGAAFAAKVAEISKELGDVMWYLMMLCQVFGLNFIKVTLDALDKLADRKERNVLHGDGDDR